MRLIKKINNNFALAVDSNGEQLIAEGKGIGFQKMPCEFNDLSKLTRTYYDVHEQEVSLLTDIPENILEICSKVYDYANLLISERINPHLPLILADHIQFCIERFDKKMDLKMPVYYDIEVLYPKESKIAEYTLNLVRETLKIPLPDSEKTGIAFNIINSEVEGYSDILRHVELIDVCDGVIERKMNININKNTFSYSRFATHMQYLLRRVSSGNPISTDNRQLYEKICQDFPKIKECVDEIDGEFSAHGFTLNQEEKLYLMLHINRLCNREDCNR